MVIMRLITMFICLEKALEDILIGGKIGDGRATYTHKTLPFNNHIRSRQRNPSIVGTFMSKESMFQYRLWTRINCGRTEKRKRGIDRRAHV